MKQLSKLQSTLFIVGGLLMVAGAGCFAFMWQQRVACWVFLVGALLFASMQVMQSYEGTNFAVKRLKKIMTMADIFFVLSGMLMVDTAWQFLQSAFTNYETYLAYVYNKWVLLLLVAAILEMYSMHRISSELRKEQTDSSMKNC